MRRFLAWMSGYRVAVLAMFAAILCLGLCVFRDYGISWDEETSRLGCGALSLDVVRKLDPGIMRWASEKYHGPAFEMVLVGVEKLFHVKDSRSIYLTRHLATFLLFFTAVLAFFLLLKERFRDWKVAACGSLFLVLSPRIFAESFYNSKDLAFLSFYVISLYTLVGFRRKMTAATAFAHALACALAIDVRLPGMVLAFVTFVVALGDACLAVRSTGVKALAVPARYFSLYAAWLTGFVVLFWPAIWSNPVVELLRAFREMKQYPWNGDVLYLGRSYKATALPWHYLPVWIAVTTPIPYTVLFVAGLGRLITDAVSTPRDFWHRRVDVPVLLCLLLPPAAIIGMHSVVYDGWRHLYFIYPLFLFVATVGLASVGDCAVAVCERLPLARPALAAGIVAVQGAIAVTMVREHPYQNVYFNRLAGSNLEVARARFEGDYWGLSYRRGLEYVLATDDSPEIVVRAENPPGRLNAMMLPRDLRERLRFTETPGEENYFLTNFRDLRDYSTPNEVFSVLVDGGKILLVEKVH